MINTERLLLRRFNGSDKKIQEMLKNWISDPAVQNEYGEPVYNSFLLMFYQLAYDAAHVWTGIMKLT